MLSSTPGIVDSAVATAPLEMAWGPTGGRWAAAHDHTGMAERSLGAGTPKKGDVWAFSTIDEGTLLSDWLFRVYQVNGEVDALSHRTPVQPFGCRTVKSCFDL